MLDIRPLALVSDPSDSGPQTKVMEMLERLNFTEANIFYSPKVSA
jgi:hypothetical protein